MPDLGGVVHGLISGTFGCARRGNAVSISIQVRGRSLVVGMCGANGKVTRTSLGAVFSHFRVLKSLSKGGCARVASEGKLKLFVYRDVIRLLHNRVGIRDGRKRSTKFVIALPCLRIRRVSLSRRTSRRIPITRPIISTITTRAAKGVNGPIVLIISSGQSVI